MAGTAGTGGADGMAGAVGAAGAGRTGGVASRAETGVVYVAGAVQGIVLVTIPGAATVFTDPSGYNLSSTRYGAMFVPQVLAAIAASVLGAGLGQRVGLKALLVAGLGFGLLSMVLVLLSAPVATSASSYPLLLAATACLGAGFGLTVPALNSLTAAFHPTAVDASVLVLNALLGVGTALAPVFVALFAGLGFWWGLPLLSAALLAGLIAVGLRLPMRADTLGGAVGSSRAASAGQQRATSGTPRRAAIPPRYWVFVAFAVLYGFCETVNGNWSTLNMTQDLGASAALASVALTTFWAMVTLGRVLFASVQRRVGPGLVLHTLPFVLALALLFVAALPPDRPALAVAAYGLAGLGCSALLPLTVSLGQEVFAAIVTMVAGGVIAGYQLGYGIAAFGVGPLLSHGVRLSTIYVFAAVVALVMGVVSFLLARAPSPDLHS